MNSRESTKRSRRYELRLGRVLGVWILTVMAQAVHAQQWQPVTGAAELREFVSGRTISWEEGTASSFRGEYRADGTGTLYAWGSEFDRTWEVQGDDQICFYGRPDSQCYTLERSTSDPSLYRVTEVTSGETTEIHVSSDGRSVLSGSRPAGTSSQAGPAAPSADEMARQLLNPANPIMKIGNHLDTQWFDGDLPGASDQTSFKYVFLTVFPFKLDNGNSLLVRPGLPVLFAQPMPDPSASDGFTSVGTELGDLKMDVIYSGTTETGTIWGLGAVGTIPTATDDRVGKDLWSVGPEVLFGKKAKWGVVGGVLGHQWDVAGSGSGKTNVTTLNYFYGFGLGNGWALRTAPVISYNHEASGGNKLNLPLGIGISKTVVLGGRPWSLNLEYWNHIVRAGAFAPQHTIRVSIIPVISAPWNKGK